MVGLLALFTTNCGPHQCVLFAPKAQKSSPRKRLVSSKTKTNKTKRRLPVKKRQVSPKNQEGSHKKITADADLASKFEAVDGLYRSDASVQEAEESGSDNMGRADDLKIVRHSQKKGGEVKFTVRFLDEKKTTVATATAVYKDTSEGVLDHVSKHKELAAPLLKQFREHKPAPKEVWEFQAHHAAELEKWATEHEAAEKAKAEQEEADRLEAEVSVFGCLFVCCGSHRVSLGLSICFQCRVGGSRSWSATRCTTITLRKIMRKKESLHSAMMGVI